MEKMLLHPSEWSSSFCSTEFPGFSVNKQQLLFLLTSTSALDPIINEPQHWIQDITDRGVHLAAETFPLWSPAPPCRMAFTPVHTIRLEADKALKPFIHAIIKVGVCPAFLSLLNSKSSTEGWGLTQRDNGLQWSAAEPDVRYCMGHIGREQGNKQDKGGQI